MCVISMRLPRRRNTISFTFYHPPLVNQWYFGSVCSLILSLLPPTIKFEGRGTLTITMTGHRLDRRAQQGTPAPTYPDLCGTMSFSTWYYSVLFGIIWYYVNFPYSIYILFRTLYISVSPDQDIGRQVSQLVRLLQDLFGALIVHADLCTNVFNRYPKH